MPWKEVKVTRAEDLTGDKRWQIMIASAWVEISFKGVHGKTLRAGGEHFFDLHKKGCPLQVWEEAEQPGTQMAPWLRSQFDQAEATVRSWPRAKREAAGIFLDEAEQPSEELPDAYFVTFDRSRAFLIDSDKEGHIPAGFMFGTTRYEIRKVERDGK